MIIRSLFLFGIALLMTAGCTKSRSSQSLDYYHPRKQHAQWDEDFSHCRKAVDQLNDKPAGKNEPPASTTQECMKAKGYIYGKALTTIFREADFTFENDITAEYFLLDGLYHNEKLAKERLDYLSRTAVENALVRRTTGGAATWYLVLVGNYKELEEALNARREIRREYGLIDLLIIKQEYGPRSRGELMLVP